MVNHKGLNFAAFHPSGGNSAPVGARVARSGGVGLYDRPLVRPTCLRLVKITPRMPRTSRRTPITMRPSIVLGSSSGGGVLTRFSACLVPEKGLLVAVPTGWGRFVLGWLFWALSAVAVCAFAGGVCAIPVVPALEDDDAVTGADPAVVLPACGRLSSSPDRRKKMPSAAAIVLIKRVDIRRYVGHALRRPRVIGVTVARVSGREICPAVDVIVAGNTNERGNAGCCSACSSTDVCRRSASTPWHCWQARRWAWQTAHSCGESCLSSNAESCSIVRCLLRCCATPILPFGIETYSLSVDKR